MKIIGIIPSRYGSTRFAGKPLAVINGKEMVWWVYQNAKRAEGLDEVIVATDDDRIYQYCIKEHMNVLMTRNDHPTAIHRLYEVSSDYKADFYVQINGDEPLMKSEVISKAIPAKNEIMQNRGEWGTNVICEISDPVELLDPSNIKMVFNQNNECIYMSRMPIPYPFKILDYKYYKHVGVIGFTPEMLRFYAETEPGYNERIEGIDLLRFIDYGKKLYLVNTGKGNSISVDTMKDLFEVESRMKKQVFTI